MHQPELFAPEPFSASPTVLCDQRLGREEVQAVLQAANGAALRFERCNFDHQDLGQLALGRASFIDCQLAEADFTRAQLQGSQWSGCRARQADFGLADLSDAHLKQARFEGADLREVELGGLQPGNLALFKGATISVCQAVALVGALGLQVA